MWGKVKKVKLMSLAKFNNTNTANVFKKDTTHWKDYKKPAELELDKEYGFFGFYLNKESKFGEHYVVMSDGFYINMPASMNGTFAEMLKDTETVDLINAGNEKIVPRSVFSKKWNKDIIVFDFV